ncbi:DMT family transporter, partial [Bacteroidota bacterium]
IITGGLAVFILYLSIIKLGIGKASVYSYSYPIFSSIFSVFILKDKIPLGKWILICIAFFGLILLSIDLNSETTFFQNFNIYELLAIGGSMLAGLSIVFVKKLHNTDNSYAIFFAQTIVGFWIFIVPSTTMSFSGSINDGIVLMAIGIMAMVGQLLMTEGYKYTSVTTGSSLHLIVPVFNSLIGILFFNEVYSLFEITGGLIIITSCLFIVLYNQLLKSKWRFFN